MVEFLHQDRLPTAANGLPLSDSTSAAGIVRARRRRLPGRQRRACSG